MGADVWIGLLGLGATLLLVAVGLLNFTVFRKQLRLAGEQIETSVRQLEIARKQPDLHLIQRAIAETSDHVRLLVERPYLRPYFYDGAEWREGDRASLDEVKAMAELMLNNFASALMHSAAFPEYPVRGIDRAIAFHLRHSPVLRGVLVETFERFPFTGLSLLCLKNQDPAGVEADLARLAAAEGIDAAEAERRRELLRIYREHPGRAPLEFTALSMRQRR
ncbi:MAG TPA: hypothetical protein VFQ45_07790 [Longimicrobium sp.]|nr:hypothetical protein [Longimicrobium sp.]